MDAERSSTRWQRRLVSSVYCLIRSRSLRAHTFQSRFLSGSPGMYGRCSANSTLNPWKGLRWRPAMKPSTTTRARTSRCASRATTAGSSAMRSPRACGVLIGSSVLPGERDHRVRVLGERTAVPAAEDAPAAKPGGAEQELELEAINPALPSFEAVEARHLARAVQLLDLDQGMLHLSHAILAPGVPHPHRVAGLGMRRLDLEHARLARVEPVVQPGIRHVDHERAARLEVLVAALETRELVGGVLAMGEAVERDEHPRI